MNINFKIKTKKVTMRSNTLNVQTKSVAAQFYNLNCQNRKSSCVASTYCIEISKKIVIIQ
jgi:hypothetical protein